MCSRRFRPLAIGLMACLTALPAVAQQGISEVRRRIVDSQNAVLPGVTVLVTNQDTAFIAKSLCASATGCA